MAISKHTLTSLHILDHERHPSLMGIGVRKEGFSVFTLLDRCVTAKVRQGAVLYGNTACIMIQHQEFCEGHYSLGVTGCWRA